MKITSTRISNNGEKSDVPVYPYAIISFPYVRGEKNAITWPICGMADIGIKTPEMKISGNRTVLSIDITSPDVLSGVRGKQGPECRKAERGQRHSNHKNKCMDNRRTEHDDTEDKRKTRDTQTIKKTARGSHQ